MSFFPLKNYFGRWRANFLWWTEPTLGQSLLLNHFGIVSARMDVQSGQDTKPADQAMAPSNRSCVYRSIESFRKVVQF